MCKVLNDFKTYLGNSMREVGTRFFQRAENNIMVNFKEKIMNIS